MAIDDIYKLEAVFLQDGKEWMIGEYYRTSINDGTKTQTQIAIGLTDIWKTALFDSLCDQLISSDVNLVATIAQLIYPIIGFQAEKPWLASPGFGGAPPLPAQVSALMGQTGDIPGRNFQGRVYLSGVPRQFETEGVMNTNGATFWDTVGVLVFGPNILAPISGSIHRLTHCNFSRKRWKAVPPTPPYWADIQAASIRPSFATQRGRSIETTEFSTP